MLKIKDYPSLRRLYPEARFIASDLGAGIDMAEDDALSFAAVPVYFEDERGRFYFDGVPVYEDMEVGLDTFGHEDAYCGR